MSQRALPPPYRFVGHIRGQASADREFFSTFKHFQRSCTKHQEAKSSMSLLALCESAPLESRTGKERPETGGNMALLKVPSRVYCTSGIKVAFMTKFHFFFLFFSMGRNLKV